MLFSYERNKVDIRLKENKLLVEMSAEKWEAVLVGLDLHFANYLHSKIKKLSDQAFIALELSEKLCHKLRRAEDLQEKIKIKLTKKQMEVILEGLSDYYFYLQSHEVKFSVLEEHRANNVFTDLNEQLTVLERVKKVELMNAAAIEN